MYTHRQVFIEWARVHLIGKLLPRDNLPVIGNILLTKAPGHEVVGGFLQVITVNSPCKYPLMSTDLATSIQQFVAMF